MLPLLWLELLETRTLPSRSWLAPLPPARPDTTPALDALARVTAATDNQQIVARVFGPDAPSASPLGAPALGADGLAALARKVESAPPPVGPDLLPPDNGNAHLLWFDVSKRWTDDREAASSLLNLMQREETTGSNADGSESANGARPESGGQRIANANEITAEAPVQAASSSSGTSALEDVTTPPDLVAGDAGAAARVKAEALADAVFLGGGSEAVPPLQAEVVPAASRELTVLPAYLASIPVPVAPTEVNLPPSDAANDLTDFITGYAQPRSDPPARSVAANPSEVVPPGAPGPLATVVEQIPPPALTDADAADVVPPPDAQPDVGGDGACLSVPDASPVPDGAPAGD